MDLHQTILLASLSGVAGIVIIGFVIVVVVRKLKTRSADPERGRIEQGQKEREKMEQEQKEQEQRQREDGEKKEFERKERSKKWDQVLKKTEKKKSSGDGWNYGMIIGNSKYDCAGLSNLPSIKDDRKLIVDRLGNQETYNIDFTFSEHTTQVDDYTNVEDIIEQVEEFMEQVEAEVTEGEGGEEEQTHF